jgi:hypothetical protein
MILMDEEKPLLVVAVRIHAGRPTQRIGPAGPGAIGIHRAPFFSDKGTRALPVIEHAKMETGQPRIIGNVQVRVVTQHIIGGHFQRAVKAIDIIGGQNEPELAAAGIETADTWVAAEDERFL